MSFGIIYNYIVEKKEAPWFNVTPAMELVKETWFKEAVEEKLDRPIDLFVVIGHNPVDGNLSTLKVIFNAIRTLRPTIPIQFFGGHSHFR